MATIPIVSVQIPAGKENAASWNSSNKPGPRKRALGDKRQSILPEEDHPKKYKTSGGVESFDVKVAKKILMKKQIEFDKQVIMLRFPFLLHFCSH